MLFLVHFGLLNAQQTSIVDLQSISYFKIIDFDNLTVLPDATEEKFETPQALMRFFLTVQDRKAFEKAYFKGGIYDKIVNTYPLERDANAKDRNPIDLVHMIEYKTLNDEHIGVLKAIVYRNEKPAPFCYFLKKVHNRWYLLFKENMMTDPLAKFTSQISTYKLIDLFQKPKKGEHHIITTTRNQIMIDENTINLSYFVHLFTYQWVKEEEKEYLEFFKN